MTRGGIRYIASILLLAALCSLGGTPAWPEEPLAPIMEASWSVESTYELYPSPEGAQRFTNKVDGYALTIPADFTVDMTNSSVRASLGNPAWKVEIYRQDISAGSSVNGYINYSNRFIRNNLDHWWEYGVSRKINGYTTHVMQWSRRDLAAIPGDFNHYACVDVVINPRLVYTFFFKADEAFTDPEQYLTLVRSFTPVAPTRTAYTVMTQGPERHAEWDPSTQYAYDTLFAPQAELTWGVFLQDFSLWNANALRIVEKDLDFKFGILLIYMHFETEDPFAFLKLALAQAQAEGRILELTLQTKARKADHSNTVYQVLDGYYDAYLQELAEIIAANRQPVLFRLGNEMNGDWCAYSAYHTSRDTAVYQAFDRYVFDQLTRHGAAPWLIKVFNPNERSFPNFKWNDASLYYPLADDADVIGLTGYNTGTYYAAETWRSFDEIYAPLYQDALLRHRQPLMITEFACSSVGGDKVQWTQDMFERLPHYPLIKAAVWWSGSDLDAQGNTARAYWLNDSYQMSYEMHRGLSGLEAGWLLPQPAAP